MNAKRAVLVSVVLALLVSGCGTVSYLEDRSAGQAELAGPAAAAGDDEASLSRDVITTGSASVRTGEPESAAAEFSDSVRAGGGRVEFAETGSRGDLPRAEVRARVPADSYAALVEGLGEYGEVVAQSTQETDATQDRVDLEARQQALQASIDRLTELMTGAGNVEELLRAEEMLTQRQAELDSLTAQLEHLADQVAMSTLTVAFSVDDDGHRPPSVVERSWDAFVTSVETMIIVLGGLLPWMVVFGAVLAVALVVIRRRRARRGHRDDSAAS